MVLDDGDSPLLSFDNNQFADEEEQKQQTKNQASSAFFHLVSQTTGVNFKGNVAFDALPQGRELMMEKAQMALELAAFETRVPAASLTKGKKSAGNIRRATTIGRASVMSGGSALPSLPGRKEMGWSPEAPAYIKLSIMLKPNTNKSSFSVSNKAKTKLKTLITGKKAQDRERKEARTQATMDIFAGKRRITYEQLATKSFARSFFNTLVLRKLDITEVDKGMNAFQNLRNLTVSGNSISILNLAHLPPSLQVLQAYDNQITQIKCTGEQTIQHDNLQHLGLGYNQLNDAAITACQFGSWCPNLVSLDVSGNSLVAARSLGVSARSLKFLSDLHVANCPVALLPNYKARFFWQLRQISHVDGAARADSVPDNQQQNVSIENTASLVVNLSKLTKWRSILPEAFEFDADSRGLGKSKVITKIKTEIRCDIQCLLSLGDDDQQREITGDSVTIDERIVTPVQSSPPQVSGKSGGKAKGSASAKALRHSTSSSSVAIDARELEEDLELINNYVAASVDPTVEARNDIALDGLSIRLVLVESILCKMDALGEATTGEEETEDVWTQQVMKEKDIGFVHLPLHSLLSPAADGRAVMQQECVVKSITSVATSARIAVSVKWNQAEVVDNSAELTQEEGSKS